MFSLACEKNHVIFIQNDVSANSFLSYLKFSFLSYLNNIYNWYKFEEILRLRVSLSRWFDMEWPCCISFLKT